MAEEELRGFKTDVQPKVKIDAIKLALSYEMSPDQPFNSRIKVEETEVDHGDPRDSEPDR